MELYIHIPFCVRKCRYCDFLSFAADPDVHEQYVDQLIREIEMIPSVDAGCNSGSSALKRNLAGRMVETIFIGGGTPSLLPPATIERILAAVRQAFRVEPDAEITMEANPGTLTPESAAGYRQAGVNRLSLGLQSASEEELRLLGRIHTRGQFLQSFRAARDAGFDNINVDLMSALPGQSEESWQETLRFVCGLEPEHISAYSLIVEEGTPLYEEYGEMCADLERYGDYVSMPKRLQAKYEGRKHLPDEETDRNMYHHTKTILAKRGYERYEISNYARPGYACRHNIGYWTGAEYLGLGLGASSLANGKRFQVTADLKRYLAFTKEELAAGVQYEEIHELSRQERMEEFMFLGLRLTGGVRMEEFERRFGVPMEVVYGDVIERLSEEGLLEQAETEKKEFLCTINAPKYLLSDKTDRQIRLTEYGLDVSTYALAEFLQ